MAEAALARTATKITTRIKYNDKDVNKKIPLFLLITNSFRGPFKTKTKENLLPPGRIFPSLWHRRCSNNKSNQVSLFYSYSDFNFFPVIF